MTLHDGVEAAILMSVGAAALTRERAEAAVADLVRRGQVTTEEGRAALEGLLARAKTQGVDPSGLLERLPSGVQATLRDVGFATRAELEDLALKQAELEHRLRLVEGRGGNTADPPSDSEVGEA